MIMDDKIKRIQYIINVYFNGNKKNFADKIGISPQSLNSWFKVGVGNKSLAKVAEAFPDIDKNWIFFGQGCAPMGNIHVEVQDSPNAQVNSPNAQQTSGSDTALVNALTQQIQDLKDQLDKKDEQIQDLIKLMMQK